MVLIANFLYLPLGPVLFAQISVEYSDSVWGKVQPMMYYVLYFTFFFFLVLLIWRVTYSRHRPRSGVYAAVLLLLPAVCFLFSLYLYGMHSQVLQAIAFEREGKKVQLAQITLQDRPQREYIQLDVTTDYFIGYDGSSRSVVQIPREQITSIESFRLAQSGAQTKYNDRPNLEGTDEQHAVQTMRQFYAAITSTGESLEQIEALTRIVKNPLRNQLGLAIAPAILQRYAQAGKLYGHGAESFFGMELSFPRLAMDGDKEVFDIFVKEHWKEKIFSYRYRLELVAGQYGQENQPKQWVITDRETALFSWDS